MIGFDLGSVGFKVVELKKQFGRFKIVGQNQISVANGIINRHGINQVDSFARSVSQSFQQAKPQPIRSKHVVAALPESFLFTKSINLPTGDPKEAIKTLQYTLQFEAAEIFPVPPEEVYIDYQVSGHKALSTTVMVVAAPKALVDDYLSTMKDSGYRVEAIQTKAAALARLFIPAKQKRSLIFCDIGAQVTKLSIFHDSQPVAMLTTPIGAVELRKKPESVKNLGTEIVNIIQYYQTKHDQKDWKPEAVILSGGGSHVPKVSERLSGAVNKLPCEVGRPIIPIDDYDPQFAVAYGLALGP